MKKEKRLLYLSIFGLITSVFFITSCDKNKVDDPDPTNDEELITTLRLTFLNNGNTSSFEFKDIDGDGGDAPSIDTLKLDTFTTYQVSVELLNESVTPAEDMTAEVEAEKAEHLFCFTPNNVDISVTITDSDGTYPVGLSSEWVTKDGGQGTVKVVLKHQPDSKDGTCSPGETDVEVDFITVIE